MLWTSSSSFAGYATLPILLSLHQFSSFSITFMTCQCQRLWDSPQCWSSWENSRLWLKNDSVYLCPVCKKPVLGETRKLRWHLRVVHSFSDGQNCTLVCSQNGCQRTYHNLNSFSRHLSREHSSGDTSSLSDHTSDHNTATNTEETVLIPDTAVSDRAIDEESDMSSSEYKGPPLSSYAATFVAQMYSASNATLSDVHRSVTCTK